MPERLLRACALLLPLIAAGCIGADRPAPDPSSSITILYPGGDERLFGPEWDDAPKFLVFQPLTAYEGASCGDPQPSLAASWVHTPDRREWTVRLRPDVRWHDGEPFTAEDVAFSIRRWKDPDVGWYGAAAVDSVEVVDSLSLRFVLGQPGKWPLSGWDVYYPKHILEQEPAGDYFTSSFWTRPVGNGPYRYVRHVPETMIELAANPDFFGGKPAIDRVILQFKAAGAGTALLELRGGRVDLVPGIPPLEAATLKDDPRYHVYYVLQGSPDWVIWNHTDPRLADPRVRRAFAHAVDRRLLHRTLGLPDDLPITDATFGPCQAFRGQLTEPWPFDAARAAALLEEAGWRDADGDGVREWHGAARPGVPRPGDPLRLTLLAGTRYERPAVFLQDQLRRVGVDLQLQVLEGSLVNRRFGAGEFQAIITPAVRSERTYAKGETPLGAPDPELARLLREAETEQDPERAVELYLALGERFRQTAPALFLNMRAGTLVAHRRIKGIGEPGTVLTRMAWRWPFGGLEDLWIEEEP